MILKETPVGHQGAMLSSTFQWFKWTVYSLIGINIVLFFIDGTVTESLDSLAWFSLLMLFEWETRGADLPTGQRLLAHLGRGVASLLIVFSALSYSSAAYVAEYGRLDTWNSWTWIAIVLVLEVEVRSRHCYSRLEWLARNSLKAVLYGALFVYAALWGIAGSWLDFYDALLWILCFFAIEVNVAESEGPPHAAAITP